MHRFLESAGKIVFLNKQDVLELKLENGQRLEDYFPEFTQYKLQQTKALKGDYIYAKNFMQQIVEVSDSNIQLQSYKIIHRK